MAKLIFTNKLKIFISLIIIAASVSIALRSRNSEDKNKADDAQAKPVQVTAVDAKTLKTLNNELKFAGTVVGNQEIKVVAQAVGTIKSLNFDLGTKVFAGRTLATIDDQNNLISEGQNDLKSFQVQQLELAVRQAKESYDLSKDRYGSDKSDSNKTSRDIAKLQYESAQIALANALNSHSISAPISGTVTSKNVSLGDSVSPGQVIATVSKTISSKIQFYVSSDEVKDLALGNAVTIAQGQNIVNAKISNISPQADSATRKFLIEAIPEKGTPLLIGTVVDVKVKVSKDSIVGYMYMPLSAISIAQTENYVFIAADGIAKKIPVEIIEISGESALVKATLPEESKIIIDGNKLVADGAKIQIK